MNEEFDTGNKNMLIKHELKIPSQSYLNIHCNLYWSLQKNRLRFEFSNNNPPFIIS